MLSLLIYDSNNRESHSLSEYARDTVAYLSDDKLNVEESTDIIFLKWIPYLSQGAFWRRVSTENNTPDSVLASCSGCRLSANAPSDTNMPSVVLKRPRSAEKPIAATRPAMARNACFIVVKPYLKMSMVPGPFSSSAVQLSGPSDSRLPSSPM